MPTRPRARFRLGLFGAAMLVLVLAVPTVLAADRDLAIRDFAFAPRTVEIRIGDTVTWTNRDGVTHSATGRNGAFDTGLLGEGESASIRFTAAGTYRYLCTPHPSMTGTVVVREAGGVAPPNTATAPVVDATTEAPTADPRLGLLAVVGGLAFVLRGRAFRRRQSSPIE